MLYPCSPPVQNLGDPDTALAPLKELEVELEMPTRHRHEGVGDVSLIVRDAKPRCEMTLRQQRFSFRSSLTEQSPCVGAAAAVGRREQLALLIGEDRRRGEVSALTRALWDSPRRVLVMMGSLGGACQGHHP
jgi:hypothetical protein